MKYRVIIFTLAIGILLLLTACKTDIQSQPEEASSETSKASELCTLIFHGEDGTEGGREELPLESLSDYELPVPAREGYLFEGWYTDRDLTLPFDSATIATGGEISLYAKFRRPDGYEVTVKSHIEGSVSISGETYQVIENAQNFKELIITPNFGYEYVGYEINGVRYEGTTVSLTELHRNTEIVIISTYATYELPIVSINTKGEDVTSKTEYTDMMFTLTNTEGELTNVTGGIRLRGKSTAEFDKKPYRIKFDQKQSLFGLEKAKSWVLLADYLDPSTLHNYVALSIAAEADGLAFTPSPYKVNVYVNGEFMGLYTLCEQIQENEGRLDLEFTITEDMTKLTDYNFYVCMNEYAPEEEDAVRGETYFYNSESGRYFELKYPRKEDFPSEAQFKAFFSQLESYYATLIHNVMSNNMRAVQKEINVDSLIDYLIVDQIMGERDHVWKSFYMFYTNTSEDESINGKLNFGPVWDYDFCLFVPWTGEPNQYYEIQNKLEYSNIFFQAVARNNSLYRRVQERYEDHFSDVLGNQIRHLTAYEAEISQSIALNHEKWYADMGDITEDNLKFLHDYLTARKRYLDQKWK